MKRPYIVTCRNSNEELEHIKAKWDVVPIEELPLAFLHEIDGHELDKFRDFDINDTVSLIIIDHLWINRFINEMTKFGYIIDVYDANDDLINDNIDFTGAPEFLKKEIKEYYFNTFDFDDVLDKMNNHGNSMDSLNDIDKRILDNP